MPEEFMEELGGSEHWPHPLQRLSDRRCPAHTIAYFAGVEFVPRAIRKSGEDLRLDELASRVVSAETPTRFNHDLLTLELRKSKVLQPVTEDQVLAKPTFTLLDGSPDQLDHLQIALDLSHSLGIKLVGPHRRHNEITEYRQAHTRLTQRREHLFDISKEQPVGPDHQNPLILKREAVGVQQVRGSMKRNDGLARAGASLDHDHAR